MKTRLTLDEFLLVEEFGDKSRSDVFPGRGHSIKTSTAGNPTDSFYFLDTTGWTVLLFNIGKDTRVQSIYSPLNPSSCISFLKDFEKIDPTLSQYLQTIISPHKTKEDKLGEIQINDGHELIFKPYSNRLEKVLQHDNKISEEAYQKLQSYGLDRLPISTKDTYSRNLEEVVTVVQKEYAIVSARKGEKKVANTFGLANCIGLTLYDRDNQIAAVAHIDGGTRVKDSISRLLTDLAKEGGQEYEARLFGGYKSSSRQFVELISALNQGNVEVVEADILEKTRSRAIGISVRGDLYNNRFEDKDPLIKDRMRLAGFALDTPLTCHYRP